MRLRHSPQQQIIALLILCFRALSSGQTRTNSFQFTPPSVSINMSLLAGDAKLIGFLEANSLESGRWKLVFEVFPNSSDSSFSSMLLPNDSLPQLTAMSDLPYCPRSDDKSVSLQVNVASQFVSIGRVGSNGVDSRKYKLPGTLSPAEPFQIVLLQLNHSAALHSACRPEIHSASGLLHTQKVERSGQLTFAKYNDYILRRRRPKMPRRTSLPIKRGESVHISDHNDHTAAAASSGEQGESHIIDILKDKQVYQEVQRSRTNDINCIWSDTFLLFFGVEVVMIGFFILFGLSMFVLLQCRPKNEEKHISLFD